MADIVGSDPTELPDALKRERVLLLAGVAGQLDAALAREVGVFDANTVWAGDGARSAAGWMQTRTELSRTRCSGITHTARDLRSCPHVEAAWQAGEIGTAKVIALLKARDIHPGLFREAETDLVEAITPMTVAAAAVHLAVVGHR